MPNWEGGGMFCLCVGMNEYLQKNYARRDQKNIQSSREKMEVCMSGVSSPVDLRHYSRWH
jgi:hypothetical protein